MINNEMIDVSVISFEDGSDEYGQKRTVISSTRTVKMFIKIFTQPLIQSPIYNEAELIGLTKDNDISDKNQILIGDKFYNVLYVIPSSRYNQVLMKTV